MDTNNFDKRGTDDEFLDIISNSFGTETCNVEYSVCIDGCCHESAQINFGSINERLRTIAITQTSIMPKMNQIDDKIIYCYKISHCKIVSENGEILFLECAPMKIISNKTSGMPVFEKSLIALDKDLIIKSGNYLQNLFKLTQKMDKNIFKFIPGKGFCY